MIKSWCRFGRGRPSRAKKWVRFSWDKKCEVKRFLNRNTVIHMKSQFANMRDIKMILQKNDLLISRIRRVRFGPYTTGTLKPGQISEADIDHKIKTFYFHHKKRQLKEKQAEMSKKWEEISAGQEQKFNLLEENRQVIQEKGLTGRGRSRQLGESKR